MDNKNYQATQDLKRLFKFEENARCLQQKEEKKREEEAQKALAQKEKELKKTEARAAAAAAAAQNQTKVLEEKSKQEIKSEVNEVTKEIKEVEPDSAKTNRTEELSKKKEYAAKGEKLVAQLVQLRASIAPFEKSKVVSKRRLQMKKIVRGRVNTLSESVEKVKEVAKDVGKAIAEACAVDDQYVYCSCNHMLFVIVDKCSYSFIFIVLGFYLLSLVLTPFHLLSPFSNVLFPKVVSHLFVLFVLFVLFILFIGYHLLLQHVFIFHISICLLFM